MGARSCISARWFGPQRVRTKKAVRIGYTGDITSGAGCLASVSCNRCDWAYTSAATGFAGVMEVAEQAWLHTRHGADELRRELDEALQYRPTNADTVEARLSYFSYHATVDAIASWAIADDFSKS